VPIPFATQVVCETGAADDKGEFVFFVAARAAREGRALDGGDDVVAARVACETGAVGDEVVAALAPGRAIAAIAPTAMTTVPTRAARLRRRNAYISGSPGRIPSRYT
jgi:hypothetical protein